MANPRSETAALTRLALEEIGGAVGGVGGIHRAISDRVFRSVRLGVGPKVDVVKAVHDGITDGVYATIGLSAKAAGTLAGHAVDLRGQEQRPPSRSPRGAVAIAIISGLRGDALEAERSTLAQPMAIRVDGSPVPARRADLARAFPDATGRVVVFLHGLMETEYAWNSAERPTYGERLETDLGATPVYIRFNTGRHISHNGAALSGLLDDLVAEWPVDLEQIALVGHSMGGLVARSACHHGKEAGRFWVRRVHHVVCLGSPHFGAPLAQLVHVASSVLARVPETRPVSNLLRRRSAGIRDLRHGSLVDEDWTDRDADALRAQACREVPLLDGAMHCFVSAGIIASPSNPLGKVIGDGFVLTPSASGRTRTRRVGFREEDGVHLPSANHFTLLNNDQVYDHLRRWLASAPISMNTFR